MLSEGWVMVFSKTQEPDAKYQFPFEAPRQGEQKKAVSESESRDWILFRSNKREKKCMKGWKEVQGLVLHPLSCMNKVTLSLISDSAVWHDLCSSSETGLVMSWVRVDAVKHLNVPRKNLHELAISFYASTFRSGVFYILLQCFSQNHILIV